MILWRRQGIRKKGGSKRKKEKKESKTQWEAACLCTFTFWVQTEITILSSEVDFNEVGLDVWKGSKFGVKPLHNTENVPVLYSIALYGSL